MSGYKLPMEVEATIQHQAGELMKLRKQLAECERERDEARNQCVKCGLLDAAKVQLAAVTKERDEAVDAVRKLSEGQPFNAVVAADITRRGLEQLATVTKERDELVEALTLIAFSCHKTVAKIAAEALAKLGADKGEV